MSTAFITGATGFVGANVVRSLLSAGWRVIAMCRAGADVHLINGLPVTRVTGDVLDVDSIRRVMPSRVDAVFHLAGDTSLWGRHAKAQMRVNVLGTRYVARAARMRYAQRLVFTSSVAAFGLQPGTVNEESPRLGINSWIAYMRSKAMAEQEIHKAVEAGLDCVILNPAHVIGPYDEHGWARMLRMIHDQRLPRVPGGSGSFCHARAVADAHVAAAARGRRGASYLLGGADASYLELAQVAARLDGRAMPVPATSMLPLRLAANGMELLSFVTRREPRITPEALAILSEDIRVDCSRAREELAYKPLDLETMVRDSLEWLREEDLLDHS